MQVEEAVRQRRSIRRFKPDPVPREMLREILDAARWTPSWGNTQPWEFLVAAGEPLARFKEANRRHCLEQRPTCPEIPMPDSWPDRLKGRYVGVGRSVLTSLDIARGDMESRLNYYGDMFDLFGAPCLILACLDRRTAVEYAMLDVGLVSQTICLLAWEKGLGTIMLAGSVRYPDLLRSELKVPADRRIVIGTAVGYPDWEAPVNAFQRERAPLDEIVTWIG